jgi:hypothetical protein
MKPVPIATINKMENPVPNTIQPKRRLRRFNAESERDGVTSSSACKMENSPISMTCESQASFEKVKASWEPEKYIN